MEQIALIIGGERDYVRISGGTGPLVYPGAHVYIYRILYALTDKGQDVLRAQIIFGVFYLATLGLVMSCYRLAKVPRCAITSSQITLANARVPGIRSIQLCILICQIARL